MQLTYLIGNGFNIKMGLKTRYCEFYKWYKDRPKPANLAVETFRSSINSNHKLWADLEIALGKYLKKISKNEDAIAIIRDVRDNLAEYILLQNNSFNIPTQSENAEFMINFFNPSLPFRRASRNKIDRYQIFKGANVHTNILVFNYTCTLEKLIGWEGNELHYSFILNSHQYIKSVEHVHGYCDNRGRLAVGVDNPEQIENDEFKKSRRIINHFVKSAYNDTFELEHHYDGLKKISESDVICCYGLSMGDSDKIWCQAIGKRMSNNSSCLLFIHFKRDMDLIGNLGPEYQEQIEEDKNIILEKIGCENNEEILDRIFVTYSDKIFNFRELNQ